MPLGENAVYLLRRRRRLSRGEDDSSASRSHRRGVAMTSEFSVTTEELWLVDEEAFYALGGSELHFGNVDGHCCCLTVSGTADAVRAIALGIRCHHTASI
jgi:hypothetical protein